MSKLKCSEPHRGAMPNRLSQSVEFFNGDLHFANDRAQRSFGHIAGMHGNRNGEISFRQVIDWMTVSTNFHETCTL